MGEPLPRQKQRFFDKDEESKELDDERKDIFHHIVAKLSFVSKLARPDIDLGISFLCS